MDELSLWWCSMILNYCYIAGLSNRFSFSFFLSLTMMENVLLKSYRFIFVFYETKQPSLSVLRINLGRPPSNTAVSGMRTSQPQIFSWGGNKCSISQENDFFSNYTSFNANPFLSVWTTIGCSLGYDFPKWIKGAGLTSFVYSTIFWNSYSSS